MLKPPKAIINWNNPLTKGLIFDFPFFERGITNTQELVQKVPATITGALPTLNIVGTGYSFGSANTDNITGQTGTFITGRYSYMAILKINTSDTTTKRIISYFDVSGGGTNRDMWLEFSGASGANQIGFGYLDSAGGFPQASWASSWAAGSFHTIFGVYDGTTQRIYADGDATNKATNTPTNGPKAGSGQIWLGNHSAASTSLNGSLFLARIWSRDLSTSDMRQLYTNPWQIYQRPNFYAQWNVASAASTTQQATFMMMGMGM